MGPSRLQKVGFVKEKLHYVKAVRRFQKFDANLSRLQSIFGALSDSYLRQIIEQTVIQLGASSSIVVIAVRSKASIAQVKLNTVAFRTVGP